MKIKRFIILFIIVTFLLIIMTACGENDFPTNGTEPLSEDGLKLCGSWAYNHDTETVIAIFNTNGTAEYKDIKYTFTCDKQFIQLKNKEDELLTIRYSLDDKGLLLYETKTYTFIGEGSADSLVGDWENTKDNWSFSFQNDGIYIEDGIFTGNYIVNTEDKSFTLDYNGQFTPTLCYYQLEGTTLSIEYPWRLVDVGIEK